MNEIFTLDEIQSRLDSEWVLLEDPGLTTDLEVVRGKVVWHSSDRDEVYAKALELRPRHPAVLYIGAPPQNLEYTLSACDSIRSTVIVSKCNSGARRTTQPYSLTPICSRMKA